MRPTLYLDFARARRFDPRLSYSRASSGTFLDPAGFLRTVAANVPRFDHDVTGRCKGILLEEAGTNLLLRSEELDNAAWGQNSNADMDVTANATLAPSNAVTGDKIYEATTANANHVLLQTFTASDGTVYCWSFHGKAAERSRLALSILRKDGVQRGKVFELADGTILSDVSGAPDYSGIINVGNGWYRCWVATSVLTGATTPAVRATLANGASQLTYAGTVNSGLYGWGGQCEIGKAPTSYIQTTSATVTRAADLLTLSGTEYSRVFNPVAGTILIEVSDIGYPVSGSNTYFGSFDDGGGNNLIGLLDSGALNRFQVTASGVGQASVDPTYGGQVRKTVVAAYKGNDFACSVNGSAVVTDTSGSLPSVTQLAIGAAAGLTRGRVCVERLIYWPVRLPDQQIQNLSR
ncbi:MAG: hypothetical protein U1E83_01025 [Methylotetracoccus sp.]